MGPLDGLKIADFSWVGAGPRATMDLANSGATVVKIESSKRLDMVRLSQPFKDGIIDLNRSGLFVQTNPSKYSVTLNLKHPRGVEIAKKLVAWADVVVENFGYGVMEKMGIGYEELRKVKPDIIMVSVSITGRTGPHNMFKGYGNSGAALSGHAVLTGWPDRFPLIPPTTWADIITPLFAVLAVLAALEHRDRTGKGQHVDLSQLETMVQFIAPAYLDYFVNGRKQTRMGNRSPWGAPHGVFPCKGKDTWCAIAVFSDAQWKSFCQAIERLDLLKDNRFSNLANRKANEDELEGIVSSWTRRHTPEQVMTTLLEVGIPSGVVQNGKDITEDAQLRERQTFVKVKHPVIGFCNHPSLPRKLSKAPTQVRSAPCLGEHNEYVYTELLGMSDEEYVSLLNEGAFE
jgi:benzylsuccinate CoA-transferase BbsF subunit